MDQEQVLDFTYNELNLLLEVITFYLMAAKPIMEQFPEKYELMKKIEYKIFQMGIVALIQEDIKEEQENND